MAGDSSPSASEYRATAAAHCPLRKWPLPASCAAAAAAAAAAAEAVLVR